MRSLLLAASQNRWFRDHATHYSFVRGTVSRFMPGETLDDALGAAEALRGKKIGTVFTHLGENIKDRSEAQLVKEHYLEVLERIRERGLQAEISVKLTQLGLDLSPDLCFEHLEAIIERAKKENHIVRDGFGTHDVALMRRLAGFASAEGFGKKDFEVQMLYGIQRAEQERLASEGCTSIVLVAYGSYWYPWFVRRLAERPANLWFMMRNVFAS